ncbi:MAG: hypothetical protein ACRERC_06825 [Candidatus Binatia bacterium]
MTAIVSVATRNALVVSTDSCVTNSIGGRAEYREVDKLFPIAGVGVVAKWGEWTGPSFDHYLSRLRGRSSAPRSLDDLAMLVMGFLMDDFRADEEPCEDIGFHVAGFGPDGLPHLYHIFYGAPRPSAGGACQRYDLSDHSPTTPDSVSLLYNGSNDIAHQIVTRDIESGRVQRSDLDLPTGAANVAESVVLRVAASTQGVGPPFRTAIVLPGNEVVLQPTSRVSMSSRPRIVPDPFAPLFSPSGVNFVDARLGSGTVTVLSPQWGRD